MSAEKHPTVMPAAALGFRASPKPWAIDIGRATTGAQIAVALFFDGEQAGAGDLMCSARRHQLLKWVVVRVWVP